MTFLDILGTKTGKFLNLKELQRLYINNQQSSKSDLAFLNRVMIQYVQNVHQIKMSTVSCFISRTCESLSIGGHFGYFKFQPVDMSRPPGGHWVPPP